MLEGLTEAVWGWSGDGETLPPSLPVQKIRMTPEAHDPASAWAWVLGASGTGSVWPSKSAVEAQASEQAALAADLEQIWGDW